MMSMNAIKIEGSDVYLSGSLTFTTTPALWDQLIAILQNKSNDVRRIDVQAVDDIDSAGVAFLREIESIARRQKQSVELVNIPEKVQLAIASFSSPESEEVAQQPRRNLFELVGEIGLQAKDRFMLFLYLTADMFYWGVLGLFNRKGQRKGSFMQQSLLIGVDALPIIGLISFLIGLILALQSAAQLRQFGANIFIADLIGIAMLREMGPIMTAVVVAGRSGSAIASEIATMVVTEEMDALKTMALNPIRYIMVPKFHGITFTMPLLTVFADLLGILGGFLIGITFLQLSARAFLNELFTVLILKDILTGLFKSVVFAWIIVIIGCYNGLRVTGGAEGVGRATTASVVMAIFFVIVADSALGLLFYFE